MSSIAFMSWWMWSRSSGVMNVVCSRRMVSAVMRSAACSESSMMRACCSRSSGRSYCSMSAFSSWAARTVCAACALKRSKKRPSLGSSLPNMGSVRALEFGRQCSKPPPCASVFLDPF